MYKIHRITKSLFFELRFRPIVRNFSIFLLSLLIYEKDNYEGFLSKSAKEFYRIVYLYWFAIL